MRCLIDMRVILGSLFQFFHVNLLSVVVGFMQSKFVRMVKLIGLRLNLMPRTKLRYPGLMTVILSLPWLKWHMSIFFYT